MVLRIREFPVAQEFREPREIPITREFSRLKLFHPVSQEMEISREFPAHGFPLNIPEPKRANEKLSPLGGSQGWLNSSVGVLLPH